MAQIEAEMAELKLKQVSTGFFLGIKSIFHS